MRRSTMDMAQFRAESADGSALAFDNCKGGYFSVIDDFGLKVIGTAAQDTLTGKNLLNPTVLCSNLLPEIGADYTNIIVQYTPIAANTLFFTIGCYLPAGTYTLSNHSDKYFSFNRIAIAGKTCVQAFYHLRSTYTWTQNVSGYTYFGMERDAGVTDYSDMAVGINSYAELRFQIELGSTATAYEPYCGGIPSPNPDYPQEIQCVKQGTKVTVCGKNLWHNKSAFNKDCSANESNGEVNVWNYGLSDDGHYYYRITPFIFHDALTYTVLATDNGNGATNYPEGTKFLNSTHYYDAGEYVLKIRLVSNNSGGDIGTWINTQPGSGGNPIVFSYKKELNAETYESINYIGSFPANAVAGDEISVPVALSERSPIGIMIQTQCPVEGKTCYYDFKYDVMLTKVGDNSFEPYIGNEATVPCDLYDGDVWYPMTGKVERYNDIAPPERYRNAINGVYDYGTGVSRAFVYESIFNWTRSCPALSTRFQNETVVGHLPPPYFYTGNNYNPILVFNNDMVGIEVSDTQEAKKQKLRDWLDAHPTGFVGKLMMPVTEQYEPQPIFAPQGTVNVMSNPIELAPELSATMLVHN